MQRDSDDEREDLCRRISCVIRRFCLRHVPYVLDLRIQGTVAVTADAQPFVLIQMDEVISGRSNENNKSNSRSNNQLNNNCNENGRNCQRISDNNECNVIQCDATKRAPFVAAVCPTNGRSPGIGLSPTGRISGMCPVARSGCGNSTSNGHGNESKKGLGNVDNGGVINIPELNAGCENGVNGGNGFNNGLGNGAICVNVGSGAHENGANNGRGNAIKLNTGHGTGANGGRKEDLGGGLHSSIIGLRGYMTERRPGPNGNLQPTSLRSINVDELETLNLDSDATENGDLEDDDDDVIEIPLIDLTNDKSQRSDQRFMEKSDQRCIEGSGQKSRHPTAPQEGPDRGVTSRNTSDMPQSRTLSSNCNSPHLSLSRTLTSISHCGSPQRFRSPIGTGRLPSPAHMNNSGSATPVFSHNWTSPRPSVNHPALRQPNGASVAGRSVLTNGSGNNSSSSDGMPQGIVVSRPGSKPMSFHGMESEFQINNSLQATQDIRNRESANRLQSCTPTIISSPLVGSRNHSECFVTAYNKPILTNSSQFDLLTLSAGPVATNKGKPNISHSTSIPTNVGCQSSVPPSVVPSIANRGANVVTTPLRYTVPLDASVMLPRTISSIRNDSKVCEPMDVSDSRTQSPSSVNKSQPSSQLIIRLNRMLFPSPHTGMTTSVITSVATTGVATSVTTLVSTCRIVTSAFASSPTSTTTMPVLTMGQPCDTLVYKVEKTRCEKWEGRERKGQGGEEKGGDDAEKEAVGEGKGGGGEGKGEDGEGKRGGIEEEAVPESRVGFQKSESRNVTGATDVAETDVRICNVLETFKEAITESQNFLMIVNQTDKNGVWKVIDPTAESWNVLGTMKDRNTVEETSVGIMKTEPGTEGEGGVMKEVGAATGEKGGTKRDEGGAMKMFEGARNSLVYIDNALNKNDRNELIDSEISDCPRSSSLIFSPYQYRCCSSCDVNRSQLCTHYQARHTAQICTSTVDSNGQCSNERPNSSLVSSSLDSSSGCLTTTAEQLQNNSLTDSAAHFPPLPPPCPWEGCNTVCLSVALFILHIQKEHGGGCGIGGVEVKEGSVGEEGEKVLVAPRKKSAGRSRKRKRS